MGDDLILLIVGFVLTTVLGGALASFLQHRTWAEQHRVQKRDEAKTQALATFEEISRLFDKRIYRMRLLNVALANARRDEGSAESLTAAREEYRAVLMEWNDNLNRVLALTEVSFGSDTRAAVEALNHRYAALGRALDLVLRLDLRHDPEPIALTSIDFPRRMRWLSDGVYEVNLRMLSLLRDDEERPAVGPPASDGRPWLALGDQEPAVRDLQAALRLDADGSFGLATYRAVRRFQQERGLKVDAIVGPETWRGIDSPEPQPFDIT
jgi:hypothetical protein